MNRLIIIGNGFDLAHGLPTSYKDFIDDFWRNVKNSKHDNLIKFNLDKYDEFNGHENLNQLIKLITSTNVGYASDDSSVYQLKNSAIPLASYRIQIIVYKNQFFKLINEVQIDNWVDIENEYYKKLKIISKHGSLSLKEKKDQIVILNDEFEEVKNLLEKYLEEKVLSVFNLNLYQDPAGDFYKFQKLISTIGKNTNEFDLLEEFQKKDHKEIKEQIESDRLGNENQSSLHVLNFNYSYTPNRYLGNINGNVDLNFIHGIIGNKTDNKINFGFGDEMDDDYKAIENIDDNEYLRNFKSFLYLQNSNYKRLLDFVESDKFQIYIMGHSCGLSDRTLLNTVFEHENCRSIKVFFYEEKDKDGNILKDNYTEITQNISRHFNKKKLMREKIVNKTLCKPLPQIQLPKVS